MTEEEITQKIVEKNKEFKEISSKLNSIRSEINELHEKREEVITQSFFDYAEIGTTINIGKRSWLAGNPNGYYLKKLKEKNSREKGGLISFSLTDGDVIEIIKINKKSINIKIIKKHKLVNNINKTISVEYPNSTFRVDRILLCRNLMKDDNFKKMVETTSKRKSILDELLG